MHSSFKNLDVIEHAIELRTTDEGAQDAVLPAADFEQVRQRIEALQSEGYSCEPRGDARMFRRGWSYCLVNPVVDGTFVLRIFDVAACLDARITEAGLDWAGVVLSKLPDGILIAGPVWRHVQTWSVAHYFLGPIDYADAIPLIESQLRAQSSRVVGPWTLPDEAWFDVRALGVDAKVRLKPCSLSRTHYLFQRSIEHHQEKDTIGVLVEITGAEQV